MSPRPESKEQGPGRIAAAVLRRLCGRREWPLVRADFDQMFERLREVAGAERARAGYRREVLLFGFWKLVTTLRRLSGPGLSAGLIQRPHRAGLTWLADGARDLRLAGRGIARSPGFSASVIVILAVAIGANTTVFTLINTLFLTPPAAVEDPDSVVRLTRRVGDRLSGSFGYPDYVYYRDHNAVFSGLAAYSPSPIAVSVQQAQTAAMGTAWTVTGNYFEVLGVSPAAGRLLQSGDDARGTMPVVVVAHAFWRDRLGGDPAAVGQAVTLNGQPFTIVGVAPARFAGLSPVEQPPDFYVPVGATPVLVPDSAWQLERVDGMLSYWLRVFGRLVPGASRQAGQANLDLLGDRWKTEFASWISATEPDPLEVRLWPMAGFDPRASDQLRELLQILGAVVAAVLLIACINIAILLLARASARHRETGIRLAIGAGRTRLVRQFLTESALLAALGGAAGLLLTFATARIAAALLPFTFTPDFVPDFRVRAFTLAVSLGVVLLFGLLPAIRGTRADVVSAIRQDLSLAPGGARDALVVAQVAVSVLLVVASALFLRSFVTISSQDLGYDVDRKLFVSMRLSNHGYSEPQGLRFVENAIGRFAGLPGVSGASVVSRKPLRGVSVGDFRIEGTGGGVSVLFNRAGPGLFGVLGVPLVAGREFQWADSAGAPPVAIVNEAMAQRLGTVDSAIGRRITYEDGVTYTVVGVVGDTTTRGIGREPEPEAFLPFLQSYGSAVHFLVTTEIDPARLVPAVLEEVRALDPAVAVETIETLDGIVAAQLAAYRALAWLSAVFGGIALVLAATGLYGVQSYLVTRRRRELAVRMALGAESRRVAREIVGRGARLALIGVGIGLVLCVPLAPVVEHLLFQVPALDPVSLGLTALLLVAVGVLASLLPAGRAVRLDPNTVLRSE